MFQNRQTAGKALSENLKDFKCSKEALVLGIPRGGVVVGGVIAYELDLPLEAICVKKVGAPFNSELAIGAVVQGGSRYLDREMINRLKIDKIYVDSECRMRLSEVEERIKKYKIEPRILANYSKFILTDDGIATGATMKAAITAIKKLKLTKDKKKLILLAVPVISDEVYNELERQGGKITVLEKAQDFGAVGQFYNEFEQTDDETVIKILKKYRRN